MPSALALTASARCSGLFFWKYDKEEACYFAGQGLGTAMTDSAWIAAHRSLAPFRIH